MSKFILLTTFPNLCKTSNMPTYVNAKSKEQQNSTKFSLKQNFDMYFSNAVEKALVAKIYFIIFAFFPW